MVRFFSHHRSWINLFRLCQKNKTNQKELVESENISRTSEAFNDNNESWSSIDNPKKDGWTTEKLAEDAQSKLNEIKELILGDLADKKFKILSPGFSFICYDDRSLEKYLESENYQTWKQTEKTETISLRRDGFWDYFLNNYTTSSEEKRVKFKIISVSGNSSIFTTRVLSSISIKTEKNIIDDRSEWNVEWIIKPDNQLLITKIEIQKFERTKKGRTGKRIFRLHRISLILQSVLSKSVIEGCKLLVRSSPCIRNAESLRNTRNHYRRCQ